ncbi:MAG: TrkA family potassium uptake protein [Chloroflexota bacterium]
MRVIIVGCGRVGAWVASELDRRGEHVTVIEINPRGFERLPSGFKGETVRGSGLDEDVMRSAGAEQTDLLMALTEGDNRNGLAAQLGKHTFGIPRVIAKINDPLRSEAYRALGIETISRTTILGNALVTAAIDGAEATHGFVEAATAEPRRGVPPQGARAEKEAREALAAEDDEAAGEPSVLQPTDGRDGGL